MALSSICYYVLVFEQIMDSFVFGFYLCIRAFRNSTLYFFSIPQTSQKRLINEHVQNKKIVLRWSEYNDPIVIC